MSYAVFRKLILPAANEKNSNEKWPIHLLTRKKENKPQVFFAKIPCYTVLSLLNHKTHQYKHSPFLFRRVSYRMFFPNSNSIFRHQKSSFNRSILCGIIGPALLLFLLLLLLFRIGKLPIDRSRKRKRNRREEEEEEMTQNRRQKKQISISDTFISGLLPYSPWNSLRCVFIYPATGEGRGEKKALNLSLFKKEPHAVFFGCVQQQNSGTSWLTRTTNSPNFCQRINLCWHRRTKGARFNEFGFLSLPPFFLPCGCKRAG